mgnify:CR=1 FL=1
MLLVNHTDTIKNKKWFMLSWFDDPSIQSMFEMLDKIDSALKFELEIKKRPAQHLGLLLLNGSYQEFEDYISKSFVKHFWKSIFLETCFTDWLNYFLRAHDNKKNGYWI